MPVHDPAVRRKSQQSLDIRFVGRNRYSTIDYYLSAMGMWLSTQPSCASTRPRSRWWGLTLIAGSGLRWHLTVVQIVRLGRFQRAVPVFWALALRVEAVSPGPEFFFFLRPIAEQQLMRASLNRWIRIGVGPIYGRRLQVIWRLQRLTVLAIYALLMLLPGSFGVGRLTVSRMNKTILRISVIPAHTPSPSFDSRPLVTAEVYYSIAKRRITALYDQRKALNGHMTVRALHPWHNTIAGGSVMPSHVHCSAPDYDGLIS